MSHHATDLSSRSLFTRYALCATILTIALGLAGWDWVESLLHPLGLRADRDVSAEVSASQASQSTHEEASDGSHSLDESIFSDPLISDEWSGDEVGAKRDISTWRYKGKRGARSRRASARARTPELKKIFKSAGVDWPPADLYLRAFKREGELELWASSERGDEMKPILTWKLCALSGVIGPKRQEGDEQVPEGFYKLTGYNPYSRYHLSMRVSYPNRADRILGHPSQPGSDIMIHGDCLSIGCLSMTDARVEELWAITEAWKRHKQNRRRRRFISLTISPTRQLNDLLALAAHHDVSDEDRLLWEVLRDADAQFTSTRRPPQVSVDQEGTYLLESR